ncbi:MAG: MFS transporter [Bacteroidales bacterium]|nr:MFS transporter [Bacteroidales bacterium]
MTKTKENGSIIAIITMIFLFGMISFVTNLAAPIGNIWKMQPGIEGSNTWGAMGTMMNFLAYAVMGIPAGALLKKKGYKFTALAALLVGLLGVFIQFLSGIVGVGASIAGLPANFFVYLFGAFVAGFSMCMLNTVVNPMLKILGGKRSNQYIQIGGSFNSLMGTLTPMLVGALIGQLTKDSLISDVNPMLFLAMGVFAFAFIVLLFVPISDPEATKSAAPAVSPLKFRHFVYGIIAIFLYVGVEVGIPQTLMFYLADSTNGAGLDPQNAVMIAGVIAGVYWLLMLAGRLTSSVISGKVSARTQLTCVSSVALLLMVVAIFLPNTVAVNMPIKGVPADVPVSAILLVLCGLCTSVMWGTIFDLAVDGLGAATEKASGIFMAMVVGGGIVPLIQGALADVIGNMPSYWVLVASVAFILFFAVSGSKIKKA